MLRFEPLIRSEERHICRLHDALHNTFRNRDKTKDDEHKWKDAAEKFRNYHSPLDEKLKAIEANGFDENSMLKEFSIDFLELDPVFFKSGYYKSTLLRKLKQVKLSNSECARLQVILIDAVRKRGQREFRDYARLAVGICDVTTRAKIERLVYDDDGHISSRAKLMLSYIDG